MTVSGSGRWLVLASAALMASCFDVDPTHYVFVLDGGDRDAGAAAGCTRVCDAPPTPRCTSANVLEAFPSTGRCLAGDRCGYTPVHVTCAQGCVDGACTGEPCSGVFCDAPPSSSCNDSAHLRTFDSVGACNNGSCTYSVTVVDCPGGCVGGVCDQNRCAGQRCLSPPPSECIDATSMRLFSSPGACLSTDGHCAYTVAEQSCTSGCQNGACVGDPCSGVVCNRPPADACLDDTHVRRFLTDGACSQGACVYGSNQTACDPGKKCVGGVCVVPSKTCNASNCAAGCCAANACVTPELQTETECGSAAGACGACSPGFRCADGGCHDVDECQVNHGGCDFHATCTNTLGGRTCTCQSGYSGDGVACSFVGSDGGACSGDAGCPDAGK